MVNYKNPAKKLFILEINIGNYLKNLKALVYYRLIVKN